MYRLSDEAKAPIDETIAELNEEFGLGELEIGAGPYRDRKQAVETLEAMAVCLQHLVNALYEAAEIVEREGGA